MHWMAHTQWLSQDVPTAFPGFGGKTPAAVSACVCVHYVCTCVYIRSHVHIMCMLCVHTDVYLYVCSAHTCYMCTCVHVLCVYIVCAHTCTSACTHLCVYMCVCWVCMCVVCVRVCIHTCMCMCVRVCTAAWRIGACS